MKINITESVNTALEAGRLMLALAIGSDKFHICNVKVIDYDRTEAKVGSIRTVDLYYKLYVGDAVFGATRTTANVRVSLKKKKHIWDMDSRQNYVCLELTNTRTNFRWDPGFKPVKIKN